VRKKGGRQGEKGDPLGSWTSKYDEGRTDVGSATLADKEDEKGHSARNVRVWIDGPGGTDDLQWVQRILLPPEKTVVAGNGT